MPVRIGTVDIPERPVKGDRIDRARYFAEMSYLELSALFAGPLAPAVLSRWKAVAPPQTVGLIAPWVLTHRKAPRAERLWPHDATVGDFRDSSFARSALEALRVAVTEVTAAQVIFKSPPLFAPSSVHRDQLRQFFGEVVTEAAIGTTRVWIPDGLWEPRAAVAFAGELGVTCAIDPLVRDPNTPFEVYEDLPATALYFRIGGLGRAGTIQSEKLEELAALVDHYEAIDLTIAFDSPSRWQDARNFKKLLAE